MENIMNWGEGMSVYICIHGLFACWLFGFNWNNNDLSLFSQIQVMDFLL